MYTPLQARLPGLPAILIRVVEDELPALRMQWSLAGEAVH